MPGVRANLDQGRRVSRANYREAMPPEVPSSWTWGLIRGRAENGTCPLPTVYPHVPVSAARIRPRQCQTCDRPFSCPGRVLSTHGYGSILKPRQSSNQQHQGAHSFEGALAVPPHGKDTKSSRPRPQQFSATSLKSSRIPPGPPDLTFLFNCSISKRFLITVFFDLSHHPRYISRHHHKPHGSDFGAGSPSA